MIVTVGFLWKKKVFDLLLFYVSSINTAWWYSYGRNHGSIKVGVLNFLCHIEREGERDKKWTFIKRSFIFTVTKGKIDPFFFLLLLVLFSHIKGKKITFLSLFIHSTKRNNHCSIVSDYNGALVGYSNQFLFFSWTIVESCWTHENGRIQDEKYSK